MTARSEPIHRLFVHASQTAFGEKGPKELHMESRWMRVLAVLMLLASIRAASAQTATIASAADTRGPTEIGIGLSAYGRLNNDGRRELLDTDDATEPAMNLRVTIPLTDRFAVEGLATLGHRDAWYGKAVEGLYGLQIKQQIVLASRPAFEPFVTYGLGGYYRRAPNGSAVDFNRLQNRHPERGVLTCKEPCGGSTATAPFIILAGGGVQQTLGRHFAVRAELQAMIAAPPHAPYPFPLGLRASAGVSMPFGRYAGRQQ